MRRNTPKMASAAGDWDTDQHPKTEKHCWIWYGPGGQEHRGPYEHDTAQDAAKAGRSWLKSQTVEAG